MKDNIYGIVRMGQMKHKKGVIPEPIIIRTLNEYKKHMIKSDKNTGGGCEIVGLDEYQVKPYFDIDDFNDILANDITIIDNIITDIKTIHDAPVNHAFREPRLVGNVMKHSHRLYVNARIKYSNIPIIYKSVFDKYPKLLDTTVYDPNKKLFSPLNTFKVYETVNELKLIGDDKDYFKCCATYIKEDYDDLDIKFKHIIDKYISKKDIPKTVIDKLDDAYQHIEDIENINKADNKFKQLQKYITLISPTRADEYDTWTKFCWAIGNICDISKISDRQRDNLIHQFSSLSTTKYNENDVDKWIAEKLNNQRENKYSWNYIIHTCIKEDNPQYYDTITTYYSNTKNEFERNNAKIMFPPVVITKNNDEYKVQSIKNTKLSYQHLKCSIEVQNKNGDKVNKTINFIDKWLDDARIRKYDFMVNKPPPLIATYSEFNTWIDFHIVKVPYIQDNKEYVINEFLSFMNNLLVNKEVVDFMLAYFAQRLQKPAYRCKVLICLYGEEGDGKNRLFDIFKNIMGDKFIEIESADLLFTTHSIIERNRLIVCVNEATSVGFSNSEKLKSRITTDTLLINEKGINAYNIDNRCDYILTTNNPNALDIKDSSRRYLTTQVSSHYNRNVEFFNKFSSEIVDNKESLRIIYEYLMAFDISSIITSGNFQNHIPNTQFQQDIITDNKDKIELFLRDLVKDFTNKDERLVLYKNKDFFTLWRQWLIDCNIKNEYNAMSFGRRLSLLIKKRKWEQIIHKDTNSNTTIDFKELNQWFLMT